MDDICCKSNDLSCSSSIVKDSNLEHPPTEKDPCSKFTNEELQERSLDSINTILIHRIQQLSSILNDFLDDSNILQSSDHVKFKLPQDIQEEIKDQISKVNQSIVVEDFQKLKSLTENIENYYQKIVNYFNII
jgi:hypothetical protein